jgi:hypothetical protein
MQRAPTWVMDTSGGDVDRQRQSQGIDEQEVLPPLDTLVGIVAADAGGLLDSLNALCVHDRRRRLWMLAHALSLRRPECREGTVPHAAEAEAAEVVVDGLPGREITGKIAPRAPRTQEIEDGFEDPAERVPRASPARYGRPAGDAAGIPIPNRTSRRGTWCSCPRAYAVAHALSPNTF